MSNVVGSKYKLKRKLKLALGRAKIAMDDVKSIDKRKQKSKGKVKEQSRKYQMDGAGSIQRTYNGYNSRKTVVHEKKRPELEISSKERKRTFSSQEIGKHKSDDIEVTSRRSLSADGRNSWKGNLIKDKRSMKAKAGETATSDRKVFPVRGKKFKDDDPVIEKGSRTTYNCRKNTIQYTEFRDVDLSHRKPLSVKRRKSHVEDSIEDESRCKRLHISRTRDGENDRIQDKKHSVTVKDSAKRLVITEVGVRSKAKTIDRKDSTEKFKASDDEALLDKHTRSKFKSNKNAEKRNSRNHTGSLDNSSKKKAVRKKSSDDESVVTDNLPKKSKRVIRIDPHDISNKRIDDSISTNEKTVQETAELSKNAQFRAIQPSPAILSFVEDNLLGRRRLIELRRAGYNIELSAPLDNIPFSTSSERERIEESVFRNKLTFFAAAKVSSSFPPADLPEIAFAGRSNVGKSSLLNALTRQWGVVRTSDKPGLTQTINFFKLASKLCLVDLPGYGFAYAKEEVKEAWEELVKEYVSTRAGLKRVCVLIDTKWGMKPRDQELIDLMERSQTKYQIVLTKTDLVFPVDVARRAMQIQECLKTNKSVVNPLMMVSSKSGAGICSLRAVLAKIARFAKP